MLSETLSLLVALGLVLAGAVHAARAAKLIESVARETHDAWVEEHRTRLCAEQEATRRNIRDAVDCVVNEVPRAAQSARGAGEELEGDLDGMWWGDDTLEVSNGECAGTDGNIAIVRREIPSSYGGYPDAWPRWAVRWGERAE